MNPAAASRIFDLILAGVVVCIVLVIVAPLVIDCWVNRRPK